MSWPTVYLIMAACMLIGLVASFRAPEPADPVQPPSSLRAAIVDPFVEFAGRFGLRRALLILTFIVVYRMGDALVNNMTTPFLLLLRASTSVRRPPRRSWSIEDSCRAVGGRMLA